MIKRCITGFVFTLVLVGFFALRYIDVRLFDILVYAFSIFSAFELTNALNNRISKFNKWLAIAFVILVFPIAEFFSKYLIVFSLIFFALSLFASIFTEGNTTLESISNYLLVLFYPTVCLLCLLKVNNIGDNSLFFLLVIFLSSCLTDVFALLFGSIFHGPKLCESISPHKTISGAAGGILGGVIGVFLSYFASKLLGCAVLVNYDTFTIIVFLLSLGMLLSIVDQIGDLFESFIKRKIGIKDMSNILPGHGGIMDRIDGIAFVSLFTYVISFVLIDFI